MIGAFMSLSMLAQFLFSSAWQRGKQFQKIQCVHGAGRMLVLMDSPKDCVNRYGFYVARVGRWMRVSARKRVFQDGRRSARRAGRQIATAVRATDGSQL